jgi:hypothetical protein
MPVAEPQKELRFTRAAQAAGFGMAAAVGITLACVLFGDAHFRHEFPELPHPAWGILPLALAAVCLRVAYHCVKHAYLILTPLGLEIFPFFRPTTGMNLVTWTEITGAEVQGKRLTLHFSAEKTSGIHLSLSPIPASRRPLLAKAILGRLPAA